MKSCAVGFTEWLLFHAWKVNESTSTSCPNLLIPETVIYRLGKPFFWYFTLPSGEILRKAKNKVGHKYILEEFQCQSEDVLAYYIGLTNTKKPNANQATIEFFTQESFIDFINNRDKCSTGILQRWIEPKSNQNSLIKVQWSPQFCLLERRVNKNKLDDNKIEFYDKLVTYEGDEYNSNIEPVTSPWIINELQKICVGIAGHIAAVTGGNVTITRMVLFFKQDKHDKIWFMYCTALKVMDLTLSEFDQPIDWQELEVKLPAYITSKKLPVGSKGYEINKNRTLCIGCNYLIKENMVYDISLKTVVEFFETGKELPKQGLSVRENDKDTQNHSDLVPKVLKRLNKKINNSKYEEMIKDPTWDYLKIKVCQDCFLHFTQTYTVPKIKINVKITEIKVTELRSNTPPPSNPRNQSNPPERKRPPPLPPIKPVKTAATNIKMINNHSVKSSNELLRPKKTLPKPKLTQITIENSSKNAIPIYQKISITSKKCPSSNLSTNYSRNHFDPYIESDFIQDTFQLLKNSINKLQS